MIKLSDSPTKYVYSRLLYDDFKVFTLIRIDKSLCDKILSLRGQLKMLQVSKIEFPDHTPCGVIDCKREKELFGKNIQKPFCFLEKFDTDDFEHEIYGIHLFVRENGFGWMLKPSSEYEHVFWRTVLLPYSILEQPKN